MLDKFLESGNASRAHQVNNYLITDFAHNIDECDEKLAEKLENFNDAVTSLLDMRDRFFRFLQFVNYKLWVCIMCIGTISCLIGMLVDQTASKLFANRIGLVRSYERFDLQIGLWVATSIFFALLSTMACGWIAPTAQGSGVPEVKTILAGINYFGYLTPRTLVAKFIGMATIQAAGFSIGFQGPMIHISAIIADQVVRFPFFREFFYNGFIRRQLLTASVACGVVCTFGTPYGGILLSVELCSSVFLVSNLFKTFFCGTVAYLVFQYITENYGFFGSYIKEPLQNKNMDSIFWFIVLGVICGGLGSLLVKWAGKLIQNKNASTFEFFTNRYLYTTFAAFAISLLTYFHPSFWYGNKKVMMDLFNRENLSSELASGMFRSDSPIFLLVSSVIIRFLVFWIMVTTPTPNGVFAPGVVIGGLIGRSYAEICNTYFGLKLNRRVFAASGAAAFAGVITRTTSPIVVLLEMTGEMDYLFGLIVTTLVANAVGSIYIVSFFDTVLNIRKLPYLPVLFSSAWYKRSAAEIAEPCAMMIAKHSNLVDLLYLLKRLKVAQWEKKRGKMDSSTLTLGSTSMPDDDPSLDVNREDYIAVVEALDNPILIGSIKAGAMFDYIEMEIKDIESKLESGNIQADILIQRYFANLKTENAQEKNNAGDSSVVKLSKDVMKYINDLTPTEKIYGFTEDGQIFEEEYLVDATRKGKRRKDERKFVKATIESIINEIKEEADLIRRAENRGRKMSRKSVKGNDDRYFQFFRQVIFRKEVRFDHPIMQYNSYPTNVRADTKLIKIHYLFQMLGTSWIFVRGDNEHVRGVITKQNFLSLRYKLSAGG